MHNAMTLGGWFLLIISWISITGTMIFCFRRIFREEGKDQRDIE